MSYYSTKNVSFLEVNLNECLVHKYSCVTSQSDGSTDWLKVPLDTSGLYVR